jgi:sorbitol/mannitol transport system permease protein
MSKSKISNGLLTTLTYFLALLMFFPVLWMVMTSFKTETIAFAFPPKLIFPPTLDNWRVALLDSPYLKHAVNTVIITGFSTLLALLLGVPAAYSLAFYPTRRTNFT